MTAVGIPGGVGVVLEHEDVAADTLVLKLLLGKGDEFTNDGLPRLIVSHEIREGIAFGSGVFRV